MLIGAAVHRPENLTQAPGNCLRSWDFNGGTRWADCEPKPGEYDMAGWQMLRNSGKRVIAVIGGTPTWAATDARTDPYGTAGGWSAPSSPDAAARYARRIVDTLGPACAMIEVGNEIDGQFTEWAATYEAVFSEVGQEVTVCAASVELSDPATIRARLAVYRSQFTRPPAAVAVHVYHWQCSLAGLKQLVSDARQVCAGSRIAVTEMGFAPAYEGARQVMPWRRLGDKRQGETFLAAARWLAANDGIALIWYDFDGYEASADGWIYPCQGGGFLAGINAATKEAT